MLDAFIFSQLSTLSFKFLWFDTIAIFFAVYVPYILVMVLFIFLIKDFKKHLKPVFGAILSACLSFGAVSIINLIFYRARPFVWTNASLLTKPITDSAFPSSHATTLFALSFFLFLYGRKSINNKIWQKVSYVFLIASLFVTVARVFSGLHWPTDIIAGIILGCLVGWAVYSFIDNKK